MGLKWFHDSFQCPPYSTYFTMLKTMKMDIQDALNSVITKFKYHKYCYTINEDPTTADTKVSGRNLFEW